MDNTPNKQSLTQDRSVLLKIIHIFNLLYGIFGFESFRSPSRRSKPNSELIDQTRGSKSIFNQQPQMLKIDLKRIPGSCRSRYTIYWRNVIKFLLKCSKKKIPKNKNLTQILVEVLRINRMVNPMV